MGVDAKAKRKSPAFISAFVLIAAAVAALAPSTPAFTAWRSASTLRQKSLSSHRGDATAVELEIHALNGRFTLAPGADSLLVAEVQYEAAEKAPMVNYVERASRGYASLFQPWAQANVWQASSNVWQVRLQNDLPFGMFLNLGSGEADVDLRQLQLFKLHVRSRSEQLRMDLSDRRPNGMSVFINYYGPGMAKLRLPTQSPVLVTAMNALTSINGRPLTPASKWNNLAYSRMTSSRALMTVLISDDSGPVELIIDEPY